MKILGRATTTLENHSGGPWYYPVAILVGFFPWSVFAIPVCMFCWKQLRIDRSEPSDEPTSAAPFVFLSCWIGVQVGLFSLASTKLPSYVTPCYPALAILTSAFLCRVVDGRSKNLFWPKVSTVCFMLTGLLMSVAVILAAKTYMGGSYYLIAIGLLPVIGAIVGFWFLSLNDQVHWLLSFTVSAVVFAVALFGFATLEIDRHQNNQKLLSHFREANPQTGIASFGSLESTWVFYGRRPIHELVESSSDGMNQNRTSFWQTKPKLTPQQFLQQHHVTLIIAAENDVDRLRLALPGASLVEVDRVNYFLKNKQLILFEARNDRVANERAAMSR